MSDTPNVAPTKTRAPRKSASKQPTKPRAPRKTAEQRKVEDVKSATAEAIPVVADDVSSIAESPEPGDGSKFVLGNMRDSIQKKGMWAGTLTPTPIPDLLGLTSTGEVVLIARPHTRAVLKANDEIIVNASDQWKHHEKSTPKQRVTEISISFCKETGRVTVKNDGPGIPITIHQEATALAGHPVYIPEIAFSYFLSGTNVDKKITNVKGGINGLGAKVANVHSTDFQVTTVDAQHTYTQRWQNRLIVRNPPEIVKHPKSAVKQYTQVSYIIAYSELGYEMDDKQNTTSTIFDDLDAWLRLRAHQVATYTNGSVVVSYNGDVCTTNSVESLAKMIISSGDPEVKQSLVLPTIIKATVEPFKSHPWHLAIAILPGGKKKPKVPLHNMAIVNGVISNKGTHIAHIRKQISVAVEEKLSKITKRGKSGTSATSAEILANVRIFMSGAIPGADWGGQSKDELQVTKKTLDNYVMSTSFLKTITESIIERLLSTQSSKVDKVIHDKYTKARFLGRGALYLLAAEGDSAITMLRAGLSQSGAGAPSIDYCGIISLQGVIVNAAREITTMENSEGNTINVRSAKLQENKRLLALADAFGLKYNYTYETAEELATLKYQQLILCVDQDLDGTGKIAALVLVWINLFWPALLRNGKIGRLMTPIIRARRKVATVSASRGGQKKTQEVVQFHYEKEYEDWVLDNPERKTAFTPKYYKGLATHDNDEVREMFTAEEFAKNLWTYVMDDNAPRLFDVYFGPDPALRKIALSNPVIHMTKQEYVATREIKQIPIGKVQLMIDTHSYKLSAIERQIIGVTDGAKPVSRKIIMGAIKRLSNEASTKSLKIFQLGGYIASEMFYHHGDSSLNGSITLMAQSHIGSRKIPYLVGVGQFGSRHGDEAGSARYIEVRLSPIMKATFPYADFWFLPYVIEEGSRAEPKYLLPVVPTAVLESYNIVSEGWNHVGYGRDVKSVLNIVDAYINGDADLHRVANAIHLIGMTPDICSDIVKLSKKWVLPVCTRDFIGDIREYKGDQYSFGKYVWDAKSRKINITELPIGVNTIKYMDTLTKPGKSGRPNPRDEYIDSIENRSGTDNVLIEIILKPNAIDTILEDFGDEVVDPLEDMLMLRSSLRPHLNYYSTNGAVLEFGSCYLSAILYWAPMRRDLYVERLRREAIIAELRILEETQIVRYIEMSSELHLSTVATDECAIQILVDKKFTPLYRAIIHRPEYTSNSELYTLATTGNKATFDYILDLRERDLVQSAVIRRRATIAKLTETLEYAQSQLSATPVSCADVWKTEIAEFISTMARGIATKWQFKN